MSKETNHFKKQKQDSPISKHLSKQNVLQHYRSPQLKNRIDIITSQSQRDITNINQSNQIPITKPRGSQYQRFIDQVQKVETIVSLPCQQKNQSQQPLSQVSIQGKDDSKDTFEYLPYKKNSNYRQGKYSVCSKFIKDSFANASSQEKSNLVLSNKKGSYRDITDMEIKGLIQKEQMIKRNYLAPQVEFYNQAGPVKVKQLRKDSSLGEVDKSINPSARIIDINSTRVKREYMNPPLKKAQSEDVMNRIQNNSDKSKLNSEIQTTVKLRKSLTNFHQSRQIATQEHTNCNQQSKIARKETKSDSLYCSPFKEIPMKIEKIDFKLNLQQFSNDIIKSLTNDDYQDKKSNREEQKLRTIIKNQYTPSLVERNLGKKLNLPKRTYISEIENDTYNIEQENYEQPKLDDKNYFSQEKKTSSNIPMTRQRIFSTKTPSKNGLIQQHFQVQNNVNQASFHNLNESHEIIMNLHRQKFVQKAEPKSFLNFQQKITNDFNVDKIQTQVSSMNNRDVHNLNMLPNFMENFPPSPIKQSYSQQEQLSNRIKTNEQNLKTNESNKPNYFQKTIEFDYLRQDFISSPLLVPSHQKTNLIKVDDKKAFIKPYINNEKILDLLFLNTCELKNIFRQQEFGIGTSDKQDNSSTALQVVKKVKFVKNMQRFPQDFFNAPQKK